MLKTNVANNLREVKQSSLIHGKYYCIALLTTEGKKTCTNIAKNFDESISRIQRDLEGSCGSLGELNNYLLNFAKQQQAIYSGWKLIADHSSILKRYSRFIQNLSVIYDSSEKIKSKGYHFVAIAISNDRLMKFWLMEDTVHMI